MLLQGIFFFRSSQVVINWLADTNGAILQVSASLIREPAKGSGTGAVVNTTA
jgi:hypothetical protein